MKNNSSSIELEISQKTTISTDLKSPLGDLEVLSPRDKSAYWDDLSDHYTKYVELTYLQSFTTLSVHTNATQAKTILEVGCGSGLHSLYLAKTML
jgi:tRNA G46 methylase TrmB